MRKKSYDAPDSRRVRNVIARDVRKKSYDVRKKSYDVRKKSYDVRKKSYDPYIYI